MVSPAPTTQVIVDATELGRATGEYLVKYVADHGITDLRAALVTDNSFSIGIERCEGFRSSVQPLADSGILKVVAETHENLISGAKVSLAKILEEHPDVNFIWCWNQMALVGAAQILKESGRSDILLAGTDMSVALAEDMLSDDIQLIAVTTQLPYEMGYAAVENAVKAANGEHTESSVSIPVLTYTKDDVDALKEYVQTHKKFIK